MTMFIIALIFISMNNKYFNYIILYLNKKIVG